MSVSIIIPCYNIEHHIEKCIRSLLEQTYSDFELLLIDDGSKDATVKICQSCAEKDNRIRVYHHANQGVSFTRNRGIDLATSDMLVFIDGDDYVKPDYLEKLVSTYDEKVWPVCGMINVKNQMQTENKYFGVLLKKHTSHKINKENFIDLLGFSSLSSPCARVYSTKIIKQNNIAFNPLVTYQEDLLFNLQYIKHIDQVRLLDYYGYYYIEHPVSSTGRYHKNFDHLQSVTDELRKMVRSSEDDLVVKEFIFQSVLRQIANVFHKDAPTQKLHKIMMLNKIIDAPHFIYVKDYICKSHINSVLKLILKTKKALPIYIYFKNLH